MQKDEANQLYQNIREARLQLSKLKQQATALQANPYNHGNPNMREYIRNAAYSLSKNDESIDKKIVQYKSKLPNIHNNRESKIDSENSISAGYKKYRKNFKLSSSNRQSQQSTKIDNSLSFTVQNRPMKIYSNYQRHSKPQYNQSQAFSNSKIELPAQLVKLKQQTMKAQKNLKSKREYFAINSKIQSRNYSSQKKRINLIDINASNIQQVDSSILRPPTQMQYNSIVDKYSKHQFMIIKGKIANDGPQFASYHRIYQSIFKRITFEINRLQQMLSQKNINFARVDGKKLAYLCLKKQIKKSQLIDCLVDQNNQIKKILMPASRYFGKKGKQLAATKIQSMVRMHFQKIKYLTLKKKTIILQQFFKRKFLQLQLQKQIHQRNNKIMHDFENRQQDLQYKWKQIKNKKRVQIHLNSIQVDEQKRLSIQNFSQRQNIQLSRMFRLKDENLILIYVSSTELLPELINYYYKMLDLAGITKYQDRLLFFTPSNSQFFPNHFSVSKLLYYSSKTLKQLKIITQQLPTLLIPGYPSNQLIKICDILKCYLFSGSPQKLKSFTSRSQTLNFLKNLSIPILPSAMDMYDYGEFLNTFSVLIIRNPQILTWVLKIDDQFGGRGIAYFNVGKSKIIQKLINKIDYGNENQFFATNVDAVSEPQNQQITIKIRDYLRQTLPQRLSMATPSVYRTYSQFMGRFIKKGGIIQAKPLQYGNSILSYPCFSFCVDPLGQYQIFTSYDKILGSPYRSYACSFPQKSMDTKDANTIIRQICQSFKIRKIFGYFTIDFIVTKQNQVKSVNKINSNTAINQKNNQFWVLGMQPCLNNYTSSYFLFDTLMGGSYFQEKNLYLIQKNDEKSQNLSINTMPSQAQQNIRIENNLIERSYIYIPHFYNQNMFMVKIKQFFKQARIERLNFDIGNKQGICLMLLDSLTSGTISMMAVGKNDADKILLIKNVLDFIARISAVKNVQYGKSDNSASSDKILLKDMLSLFVSMTRKDLRSNAKVKALKEFENNQNLELIV